jgi:hypothetical protein
MTKFFPLDFECHFSLTGFGRPENPNFTPERKPWLEMTSFVRVKKKYGHTALIPACLSQSLSLVCILILLSLISFQQVSVVFKVLPEKEVLRIRVRDPVPWIRDRFFRIPDLRSRITNPDF